MIIIVYALTFISALIVEAKYKVLNLSKYFYLLMIGLILFGDLILDIPLLSFQNTKPTGLSFTIMLVWGSLSLLSKNNEKNYLKIIDICLVSFLILNPCLEMAILGLGYNIFLSGTKNSASRLILVSSLIIYKILEQGSGSNLSLIIMLIFTFLAFITCLDEDEYNGPNLKRELVSWIIIASQFYEEVSINNELLIAPIVLSLIISTWFTLKSLGQTSQNRTLKNIALVFLSICLISDPEIARGTLCILVVILVTNTHSNFKGREEVGVVLAATLLPMLALSFENSLLGIQSISTNLFSRSWSIIIFICFILTAGKIFLVNVFEIIEQSSKENKKAKINYFLIAQGLTIYAVVQFGNWPSDSRTMDWKNGVIIIFALIILFLISWTFSKEVRKNFKIEQKNTFPPLVIGSIFVSFIHLAQNVFNDFSLLVRKALSLVMFILFRGMTSFEKRSQIRTDNRYHIVAITTLVLLSITWFTVWKD